MSDHVLTATDLTVELSGVPVVRGVDLHVGRGETVALMGGNGSGKSTLVRAVLRLVPHARGRISFFGEPEATFRAWSRVGYVPQRSAATLSGAKVREVVAAGRLSRRRPFVPPREDDRRAVRASLEAVGMADRAADQINELSGGQQQRVLIARALAGEPDLLIMDEPMAGVDLANQQLLADLLREQVAQGRSVLVVLHETGPLGALVDRAVLLHDGRVIGEGPLAAHRHTSHHDHHDPATDGWLGGAVPR